jgi:hypothetical protein
MRESAAQLPLLLTETPDLQHPLGRSELLPECEVVLVGFGEGRVLANRYTASIRRHAEHRIIAHRVGWPPYNLQVSEHR